MTSLVAKWSRKFGQTRE